MPVNRIWLLVVIVGGLVLFASSNWPSEQVTLVFLNREIATLPLIVWIASAIAAGAITSFCLQLLNQVPKGYSNQNLREFREVPPQTRSVRREAPQNDTSEYETPDTPEPPKVDGSSSRAVSDWDTKIDRDWELDEEPASSKSTQPDFERDFTEGKQVSVRTNYEVPQEPKTSSKIGSVYSYSYREKEQKDSGVGKTDEIYDANYRLIRPPYKQPIEQTENEEDWDFDDEDF
ncbi:MAG: LapA family protein [Symploca sp. SIO2C1]|nr:LapA family protein [Symploca sp. SIO2C1]